MPDAINGLGNNLIDISSGTATVNTNSFTYDGTQKEPTVKGVVVVCEGADNSVIVNRVTDAVTKSLNIKTNRISVVKKQQTKNK